MWWCTPVLSAWWETEARGSPVWGQLGLGDRVVVAILACQLDYIWNGLQSRSEGYSCGPAFWMPHAYMLFFFVYSYCYFQWVERKKLKLVAASTPLRQGPLLCKLVLALNLILVLAAWTLSLSLWNARIPGVCYHTWLGGFFRKQLCSPLYPQCCTPQWLFLLWAFIFNIWGWFISICLAGK